MTTTTFDEPPRWIYLERSHFCANCGNLIEGGKKMLVFPVTGNHYCQKCAQPFVGKSKEGKPGREYMPPAAGGE